MLLSETLVTQLMTRQPVTVEPDASVDEALRLLGRYPFRHLPVARGDEVCGILSDRDLLLATGWMSNAERSIQDDPRPVGPATVSDVMRVDVRTAEPGTTVGEATSIPTCTGHSGGSEAINWLIAGTALSSPISRNDDASGSAT